MILQGNRGGFVVFSRGEALRLQKDLFDRQTLGAVRYADPAAWVLATATARALRRKKGEVSAAKDRIGVVVVSSHGPIETLRRVAEDARSGFASPLRYPASNPGSVAGVSSILFGLQGPTLNLLIARGRCPTGAVYLQTVVGSWGRGLHGCCGLHPRSAGTVPRTLSSYWRRRRRSPVGVRPRSCYELVDLHPRNSRAGFMNAFSPDAVGRFLDRVQDLCTPQSPDRPHRSFEELARSAKVGLRPGDLVVLRCRTGRNFYGSSSPFSPRAGFRLLSLPILLPASCRI